MTPAATTWAERANHFLVNRLCPAMKRCRQLGRQRGHGRPWRAVYKRQALMRKEKSNFVFNH